MPEEIDHSQKLFIIFLLFGLARNSLISFAEDILANSGISINALGFFFLRKFQNFKRFLSKSFWSIPFFEISITPLTSLPIFVIENCEANFVKSLAALIFFIKITEQVEIAAIAIIPNTTIIGTTIVIMDLVFFCSAFLFLYVFFCKVSECCKTSSMIPPFKKIIKISLFKCN